MYSTYILLFLLLIFIFVTDRKNKNMLLKKMIKSKRMGRTNNMTELIERYIGKECLIYTCMSSSQISGIIHSCKDGWIEIENANGQRDIINCDYITRIREYPRNKNGKKKSIVTD